MQKHFTILTAITAVETAMCIDSLNIHYTLAAALAGGAAVYSGLSALRAAARELLDQIAPGAVDLRSTAISRTDCQKLEQQ
jgi:hypothetical protein